jgi:adenylosuccinate synthase
MVEATKTITCDEIMAERDRLMVAVSNKLNQLASTGTTMLIEGHQGLTLQHIFFPWQSQSTAMPSSGPQECSNELKVRM